MKNYISLALIDLGAAAVIVYTVCLGNHASWTTCNLSVIGYWYGYSRQLVIWGWITAAVFMTYLVYLMRLYRIKSKIMNTFILLAGILLIVGVYLPYQPGMYPVLSNLHIGSSFMAPVCVVAAVISLMVQLLKRHTPFMRLLSVVMLCLIIGAAVIFFKCTIISTLLEVYVVSALTGFMTVLALIGIRQEKQSVQKQMI